MRKRSGLEIMLRLIKELKPLLPIIFVTIITGVIGFICSIFIGTFGAIAIGTTIDEVLFISFEGAIVVMIVCALMRGILRYCEQLSGHYIAFKILYILRDKVFSVLRKLAPAKLESKEKGNLISIITSDIELLEVFYAHTIAPIAIALITNSIIAILLFKINIYFGCLSVFSFLIVGLVIPYYSSNLGKTSGAEYRECFAKSNSYILESLRGLKEILLFQNGEKRLKEINNYSKELNKSLEKIKRHEGIIRALTDLIIMLSVLGFVLVGFLLYSKGNITFTEMLIAIVMISSSFGPVVALSNLSNTLLQTFASAERIFAILDEKPMVKEVIEGASITGEKITYKGVDFTYENRENKILENCFINIKQGEKISIIGKSGVGKSTFIKLIMRFWDVKKGEISIDNKNIKEVSTSSIRKSQALVSQETYLFNDSIENNIKIGNKEATKEEVIEAAKKASIHGFIMSLPKGYKTNVGELGGALSSGEKQRIGLARAFLHDGNILILDEPTSNLDALNEGRILKSIKESCKDKTIILISHRKSTTAVGNKVYKLEKGLLQEI